MVFAYPPFYNKREDEKERKLFRKGAAPMSFYVFKLITLFGGLALFLFGMDTMGKALERQAGGKL